MWQALGLLIFIPLFSIFNRINRSNGKANLYSAFAFSFGLYYFIIPFAIYLFGRKDSELRFEFENYVGQGGMPWFFYYFYLFLIFLFFTVFYHNYKPCKSIISTTSFESYLRKIGWTCLVVGGISLFLYIRALGGLVSALAIAEFARSFATDMAEEMGGGISYLFIVSAKLLLVTPYCFLYLYLADKSRKNLFLLISALVLDVLLLLIMASRAPLIILLIAFSYPIISKYTKHPWVFIVIFSLLGSEILSWLDALFVSFGTGTLEVEEGGSGIQYFLMQFAHPHRSVLHSFEIVNRFGIRFGKDFIISFFNMLPGLSYEMSYEPVSTFFGGANWRATGGIPSDFVTFGVLQFHFIGPFILSYFVAIIIKKSDALFMEIQKEKQLDYFVNVFRAFLMLLIYGLVSSADFIQVVSNYSLLFFFTAILMSYKKKIKRVNYEIQDCV